MKLFCVGLLNRQIKNAILFAAVSMIVLQSCATHHSQFGPKTVNETGLKPQDTASAHTFFLIGDAGDADDELTKNTLAMLQQRLKAAPENSTLLFLGDNIYPRGMPPKEDKVDRAKAETILTNQLQISNGFKGKTIFIAGNHDWYNGIKGLEREAKFVTEYLKDKKSYLPRNSCGIEELKINDAIALITIDSQWFLEDWNTWPTINDDCGIKTREDFFIELEGLINKNQNKTIILAMHHPLVSNGPHGGQFSLRKQLYPSNSKIPAPVLGSLVNLLRKTSGISPEDLQNKQYQLLINRIKPLIQNNKNIIVVSGHEHNLQFIDYDGIRQVISGSASKHESARATYPNNFSFGGNGFATLEIKNKVADVTFYSTENNRETPLFKQHIATVPSETNSTTYNESNPSTIKTAVYSKKATSKSLFYRFLWGNHYRKYYSMPIDAKVAMLDTLYGGLKPVRAGGGHQSISLRLVDNDGKEYVMRALRKSATRLLQSVTFKDQNIESEFKNTVAEKFIADYYTTSHPYTPFILADLSKKVGVLHTNSALFYVPKQNSLGKFNSDFGGELYLIEERPIDENKELENFGKPDAIVSTDEVFANIRKDEKYQVDEVSYIRARLFDMVIGDWDRHADQWRWAAFKAEDRIVYKPIPRDRDQAFTKADGALLSLLIKMPGLRHMKSFKKDFPNVRWFNMAAHGMDIAFIKKNDPLVWSAQANYIREHLTDTAIDSAFAKLPKEVIGKDTQTISDNLKSHKNNIEKFALAYSKLLQETVLIVGTDKKDKFVVTRLQEGKTKVEFFRIKKDSDLLVSTKIYDPKYTNEIWIYALDDDDVFEVKGNAGQAILIRLLGGQNNDRYTVENGKKIKIYDFKSKENTIAADNKTAVNLSDDYEVNGYNYKKPKYSFISGLPILGFNPDDGIKFGIIANYTVNGFRQNPYTQKHTVKANFYFATQGYELMYNAYFPESLGKWGIDLETRFTSPNFAINYFGYGNETANYDQAFGMDFNRVKIRMVRVAPSIKKIGRFGSEINLKASYENIEVEETNNRFINIPNTVNNQVFENQQFAEAAVQYSFENYDRPALPTMGMGFSVSGAWKMNLREANRNFPMLEAKVNFNHKLDTNAKLVFAILAKGKKIFNNNYEFYQGATLGGDYDLRGFRNERFLGKSSFFVSNDLRYSIGKIRGSLIPMSYGILGGYDYGRVWLDAEDSDRWHQSFGGGLWLNGLNIITARVTAFKSTDDKMRIAFGLGFGF